MYLKRKFVWLMVLMIWVGMVSAVIVEHNNGRFEIREVDSPNISIESLPSNESLPTNENSNEGPGTDTSQENFFVEYRLQRERARSEQIAIYREMINNPNITEEARNKTQEKMMDLTEKMEKEVEIESLIRARGYEDALAYLHENSVDVIVRSSGLNEEDVARIGDIIVKTTGLGFDDVTIIEKKVPVQN